MIATILLAIIAFVLDWHSTIIQSFTVEENPVMKWFWQSGGNVGFTVVSLLFLAVVVALIRYTPERLRFVYPVFWLFLGFKILIALTNYDLIPYSVTAWYQI